MSGQRSWEPSSEEIAVVTRAVGFAAQYDATANLARVTGVRAQIAKLEEARGALCNIPENLATLKLTSWLAKEIALLEKELA